MVDQIGRVLNTLELDVKKLAETLNVISVKKRNKLFVNQPGKNVLIPLHSGDSS